VSSDDEKKRRRPRVRTDRRLAVPLLDTDDGRDATPTIPDSCPTIQTAAPIGRVSKDTVPAPPSMDTVIDDLLERTVEDED
jgi:hypothetical protein